MIKRLEKMQYDLVISDIKAIPDIVKKVNEKKIGE